MHLNKFLLELLTLLLVPSIIFSAAGKKKFQRANAPAVRVWCKWCKWFKLIHPTIDWRPDEHETHKHAHGLWIICSVSRVRSKTMRSLFCITSQKLPYITKVRKNGQQKTWNLSCNTAAEQVEKRCCAFYHLRSNLLTIWFVARQVLWCGW